MSTHWTWKGLEHMARELSEKTEKAVTIVDPETGWTVTALKKHRRKGAKNADAKA